MADPKEPKAPPDAQESPEVTAPTRGEPWWKRLFGRRGRRVSALRRWSVFTLVVMACIGILVSAVALWTHSLLFNTDRYVKTVAPIGKDPEVTKEVATYVTDQTMTATDFRNRVREVLPDQAKFLADPITQQVHDYLYKKVYEFLQTDTAYNAWVALNRNLHAQLVAVLRDQTSAFLVEGDEVRLNLLPVVAYALDLVQKYMPDALGRYISIPQIDPNTPPDEARAQLSQLLGRELPPDFGTILVFKGDQVTQAQQAVHLFDRLVVLVVVVTVLLIAAALALSPWRLRTALQLGVGTLLAVVAARIAIKQLEDAIVSGTKNEGGAAVTKAIVTSAVNSLSAATTWLLVGGAILAVAAFLGSRPHWLAKARDGVVALAEKSADLAGDQMPEAQRLAAEHLDYLRGGGVVVAVIVLLFASGSLTLVFVTVAALAAWETGVWWLARRAARGSAHA